MKLHKKHWGAVLLAGVVAVGVLAWGSYSRDTFSFEATNMNAWVEGGLSEEFRRLVESGAPLQLERPTVHSDDATTFEIVVTGTMDHKVVTGTVIATTSMRYDMTHDTLYLVPRDSNCTLLDDGAAGSRPETASQLCVALSASIREAFNRTPLQIHTSGWSWPHSLRVCGRLGSWKYSHSHTDICAS